MIRKREEIIAFKELKRIDPEKYRRIYFDEIPDIQTRDKSVGVEVVRADYEDLIKSCKAIGKDIINAKKMMGDKPLTNYEIELILDYQCVDKFGNPISLQEFEGYRYLYVDKKENEKIIKEITDYDDLKEKYKKYEIWKVDKYYIDSLSKDFKVKIGRPLAIWIDNWYKLFIERIDSKIKKFVTYNKFKENNLAIVSTFTYDNDFERVSLELDKYYKKHYMPFDNIYLMCGDTTKTKILSFSN